MFCILMSSAHLNEKLWHLQEEPLVLTAVDLLGHLNELLGGIHFLTTCQQLSVQGLQLSLLLLPQSSRPLIASLRQRLQHVVVVLLKVLFSTAKILLNIQIIVRQNAHSGIQNVNKSLKFPHCGINKGKYLKMKVFLIHYVHHYVTFTSTVRKISSRWPTKLSISATFSWSWSLTMLISV